MMNLKVDNDGPRRMFLWTLAPNPGIMVGESEDTMNDAEIDALIHALLNAIDYDIAKQYKEETAEDPDSVEDSMDELRDVVWRHIVACEPRL